MGGTEATVVRVAEGLGDRVRVVVGQHNRKDTDAVQSKAAYVSAKNLSDFRDADAVVVMRDPRRLAAARKNHPHARVFLWITDWLPPRLWPAWYQYPKEAVVRGAARYAMSRARATILTVSATHEDNVRGFLRPGFVERLLRRDPLPITFIYPPVMDDLVPDATSWDNDKLVYFSRPDRRFDQVLTAFAFVRKRLPSLRLVVGNPGYMERAMPEVENVEILGALPHGEIIRHVRTSLCAFYPNTVVPEAFGLVFAESNAIGTPVLTHCMGAAPEILSDEQFVDARDLEQVAERIIDWHNGGRANVRLDPKFRLSAVLKEWEALLQQWNPPQQAAVHF